MILFALSFSNENVIITIEPSSQTQIDVYIENAVEVAGFQFKLSNTNITSSTGGIAIESGFNVTAGGSTVIGFSMTGGTIPVSTEKTLLTSLVIDTPTENEDICFDCGVDIDCTISDASGEELESDGTYGDCINFEGCTEGNDLDNFDDYAIFDDGSCSCYDDDCLDCAGNVGGTAEVNGCGTCICNGETAQGGYTCEESEDCVQGCDGNYYTDGMAPVNDECGVCDGDDTSCLPVEFGYNGVSIEDSTLSIQLTNYQTISSINFKLSNLFFADDDIDTVNAIFSTFQNEGDTLFNFTNGSLEAGTHTLLTLKFTPQDATSCISEVSIFGNGIEELDVNINEDCTDIAIEGCTESTACNFDETATLSTETCTYPTEGISGGTVQASPGDTNFDCSGECILTVDECEVCGGNGTFSNYDCDGECTATYDECGVCNGDNSYCINDSNGYLMLSSIVTLPDDGEMIVIKNMSNEEISLENHYISDDKEYYKIQSESKTTVNINDFIAKFSDDISIAANDSLHICLSESYTDYYPSTFQCDLILQNDLENIFPDGNSFGSSTGERLSEYQEMVILFYWDGDRDQPVRDIDYFVWGNQSSAMDKSNTVMYFDETSTADQDVLETQLTEYQWYRRISFDENESTGLNGYTGEDETSELFNTTWEIESIPYFIFGCTDSNADNYESNANADDGSCVQSFISVLTNCTSETVECSGKYDLPTNNDCPLYGQSVSLQGTVVDFYDITPNSGPYSFTLEDNNGYRISFVVWPTSSQYQDGFDILQSGLASITDAPFNRYVVSIKGKLDVYCSNETTLDIYNDWQVVVEYEDDISIIQNMSTSGEFKSENVSGISINPEPYVLISALGGTLDFSFSVYDGSRAIVRIFDLSGRFITSLVDDYYESSGVITHSDGLAPWDGRDKLGQIVPPGTYIMHLEVFDPTTGETHSDAKPVVVGVRN